MALCEYGCRRKGKFLFKNGKWCCEDHFSKCPVKLQESAKRMKGKRIHPRKWPGFENWTDCHTDPRKFCYIDEIRSEISWYYWNLYFPNDKIIHGDGMIIHHKNKDHWNNSKENLQKMTIEEHASLHHKGKIVTEKWKKNMSKNHPRSKPVLAGGKKYSSLIEAGRSLEVSIYFIDKRIKSHKPGYKYL